MAAVILLCSSAGAWPVNLTMSFSGERTLDLHLFQIAREIHRPYHDSIRAAPDYLLEHTEKDELVYVPNFADREALTFSIGHHVLFHWVLDDETPLPSERVQEFDRSLHVQSLLVDWIVVFWNVPDDYWERIEPFHEVAEVLNVYPCPTHNQNSTFTPSSPCPMSGVCTSFA